MSSEVDLRSRDDFLEAVERGLAVRCACGCRQAGPAVDVAVGILVDHVEARVRRLDVLNDAGLPEVDAGADRSTGVRPGIIVTVLAEDIGLAE